MVSILPLSVMLLRLVMVRPGLLASTVPSLNHRILGVGLPVALQVRVRLLNSSIGPADPPWTTLAPPFKLIPVIFGLSKSNQ